MGELLGTTAELEITNVAHGGVSVARLDGRVVFVADTLPGETVLARISSDDHASFWRAETVEVLTPSEHRREHVWHAASLQRAPDARAGGAEFGHIELCWQRELKRVVVVDSLRRFAHLGDDHAALEVTVEAVEGDDERNGLGWRTRVNLHVDESGIVGPYAARSHRVVAVPDLPLAIPAVEYAAPLDERLFGVDGVDVISDGRRGARVVTHRAEPPASRQSGQARQSKASRGRPSARQSGRPAERPSARPALASALPTRPPAGPPIVERVGEREFRLDELGFWQVHHGAAATLTAAVQQQLLESEFDEGAPNLDLYGGVGLLAAAVADRFGVDTRIQSVESDAGATANAAHNLRDLRNATAVTERVDRYLSGLLRRSTSDERAAFARASFVIDPPRSGAQKQVIQSLLELHPAQLLYVACDPVAFARDLGQLTAGGYELRSLRAFDLFPHTHHVEAVGLLTPAE
ncbi:class I SAM-dependent RNA methyltransferase [Subtercola endophyticus]|uniref:class I SAM-dependent RNA methyltransferase n=1 Tax=Subtercola endophyticus TaxID=2895559 RepID=UPI001E539ED7|nr:TRAM domain-containing protein [Subtercola endophyticus]UFS57768.1 class I SAM-dependent RNA methyltransferase [Subtercola endophyticus]